MSGNIKQIMDICTSQQEKKRKREGWSSLCASQSSTPAYGPPRSSMARCFPTGSHSPPDSGLNSPPPPLQILDSRMIAISKLLSWLIHRFVPEKFEEILKKFATTKPNALTSKELDTMREGIKDQGDIKGS